MRPVPVLVRHSLLEAARSGLPWLAVASLAAGLGLAAFVSEIAITEGNSVRAAISSAFLRVICALLVGMHVVSATVRDYNDRVIELSLAFPLSRSTYYLGRLLGFVALAALLAIAMGVPLLAMAPPAAVLVWTAFLAAECALVASAAFFFSISIAQMVPALAATMSLYVLARIMPSIKAIAASPLAGDGHATAFGRVALEGISLLLPRLDSAAKAEWLLYGIPSGTDLAVAFAALAIYGTLLCTAGLFDFHRRNL